MKREELCRAEREKGLAEELFRVEKQLQQKEEDYDILVAAIKLYTMDYERRKISRPSLAPLLQGTKRPHPDESQHLEDRNTRRRTETAKN